MLFLPRNTTAIVRVARLYQAVGMDDRLPFEARVVRVVDGDTIKIRRKTETISVRFQGIDAPERAQSYGPESTEYARALVDGKRVRIEVEDVDKYGRLVAMIYFLGEKLLNESMLSGGMAWWYRKYAMGNTKFAALEAEARKARVGLWIQDDPEPPWEWRRRKREDRVAGGLPGPNSRNFLQLERFMKELAKDRKKVKIRPTRLGEVIPLR